MHPIREQRAAPETHERREDAVGQPRGAEQPQREHRACAQRPVDDVEYDGGMRATQRPERERLDQCARAERGERAPPDAEREHQERRPRRHRCAVHRERTPDEHAERHEADERQQRETRVAGHVHEQRERRTQPRPRPARMRGECLRNRVTERDRREQRRHDERERRDDAAAPRPAHEQRGDEREAEPDGVQDVGAQQRLGRRAAIDQGIDRAHEIARRRDLEPAPNETRTNRRRVSARPRHGQLTEREPHTREQQERRRRRRAKLARDAKAHGRARRGGHVGIVRVRLEHEQHRKPARHVDASIPSTPAGLHARDPSSRAPRRSHASSRMTHRVIDGCAARLEHDAAARVTSSLVVPFLRGSLARSTARVLALAALCTVSLSCTEELDLTRTNTARGTLGAEIYEVICLRIAAGDDPTDVSARRSRRLCEGRKAADVDTPPRLAALDAQRERLVDALDRTLPEPLEDDLSRFLLQILPLYDPPDDVLPAQTRAAAALLDTLAQDDEALDALARLGQRRGYRPLRLALGVARPLLAYPDFDTLARQALTTIDTGGAAGTEWEQLLRVTALEMATANVAPPPAAGARGTLAIARELLFTEDAAFGAGPARYLVARDLRGLAQPEPRSGTVPAPFVDADRDGLADIDALGRFVAADGALLALPTPFTIRGEATVRRDPAGRALRDDGAPLFRTFDASRTLLAGVTREAAPWFAPDAPVALDLAVGLPLLLGPETDRNEEFGATRLAFRGPDTRSGPLFDVLHAGTTVLDRPELDDALGVVDTLLTDHEPEVAALLDAIWVAQDSGDANPRARVDVRSDLWDDLLTTTEAMAQTPGLLEALVRALAEPASADLGPITATFLRYSDRVEFDPANVNGPPLPAGPLARRTDWARPDVANNESLFQRSIAVIQDLDGVRVCNKAGAVLRVYNASGGVLLRWPLVGSYGECELIQIDNVAETYVQSVLGRARIVLKDRTLDGLLRLAQSFGILTIDGLLEGQSGVDGLTQTPTPQALGRLVFAPANPFIQGLLDASSFKRDRNGDGVYADDETVPIADRHAGVVPSWEKTFLVNGREASFLSALTPLLRAFDDHDPPGGRFLFGALMRDLHLHWPTRTNTASQRTDPRGDMFSQQDDVRSYEPILADLFERGALTARLGALVRVLDAEELRPGTDGVDALVAATNVLVDPSRSCGGSCATGGGLRYRSGRDHPCTSSGICFDGMGGRPRRYVSPLYLLIDGLASMDRALERDPARLMRWRSARTAIAEQLLRPTAGSSPRLANRRALALLRAVVPFARARIAEHRTAGDLTPWSRGLTARAESTLGSAATSAALDFLVAVEADPAARDAIAALVAYLIDDASANDALDTTLLALADLLQVLEDDANLTPLLRALAVALASDPRAAVDTGAALTTDGAVTDATLTLIRRVDALDDRGALLAVLANLVSLPAESAAASPDETPLETIVDVIAEVNRRDPGAGGTLAADDYRAILETTRDFLRDEDRGMERLYRVVQERELDR